MDIIKLKGQAFDVMLSELLKKGIPAEVAIKAAKEFANSFSSSDEEYISAAPVIQKKWRALPVEERHSKGRSKYTASLENHKYYWVKLRHSDKWIPARFDESSDYTGVDGGFFSFVGTDDVLDTGGEDGIEEVDPRPIERAE